MSQTSTTIWLDCDPGHDDAMAIILAGWNEHINLLGISTIMGNQTVDKTTRNALVTLAIAGIQNVDVVKGQSKSIMRNIDACAEIHGESGMDVGPNVKFPDVEINEPVDAKGVVYMYEKISAHTGPVTLVCTGALTNAALLVTLYPEVLEKIEEIVLMGGAIGVGNMSPVAEWNIMVDPEAAKIIFECGAKVVMVPTNVTHTVLVTKEILESIKNFNTPFGTLMGDLLTFFGQSYDEMFNMPEPPLHDPVTIAYLINPELFEIKHLRVDIETVSPLASGQTIVDIFNMTDRPKNAYVALKVDVSGFWELMLDALSKANEHSPLNTQQ
eukprot:TRINITY_DN1968_c0_g1_i1.p1 TRINITY_DN1968_c0_g1~~TRINITY_DN1968_c0_g1_i1.p1  ORF type:complete len:340 (+),score=74.09 TRINITY_DN1968_c0_g1_i1:42-1022(+)